MARTLAGLLLALALLAPATLRAQTTETAPPETPPPAADPQAEPTAPGGAVSEPAAPGAVSEPAAPGAVSDQPPGAAGEETLPPGPGEPGSTQAGPPKPARLSGPPGAGPDRLDFDLKFPADQGGGSAAGSAEALDYQREGSAALSGKVKIRYQDIEVAADRAEIDMQTKVVRATGHVVIDQGPRRMAGDTAVFDLKTKTGKLTNASAQVAPDYYFKGAELEKTGDNTYAVRDGTFTSCKQKVPDWSFRVSQATVEVEGYAHVRHASMRAKKLPVFYTPYMLWPVKSERSSGLLIPNIGYSERRGSLVGLAYFQALGRSYDTTIHVDPYSEGYLGIGDEFRYRPTEGTEGTFIGYAVRDPELDEWRWKTELNHVTNDLFKGMRAVIRYQNFSDFDFFRDFERDFDRNSFRFVDSRAFVTGNWGPHLLNVLLNDRDTFIDQGAIVTQRKLPEIEYRLRSTRLGKLPLYLQFQGSVDYLEIDRPTSYVGQYARGDAFPQLTLPIRTFPWLSLSLTAGERLTWYGDSLDGNPLDPQFSGESLSRELPFGSAQIVGPSVSKIYNGVGVFSKFKHVIEPRFVYTYQGEVEDQERIPLFDDVDTPFSTNSGRVALVNRVLGKLGGDAESGGGSAREILNFELAQSISFDSTQPLQVSRDGMLTKSEGPIEALLRFNPGAGTSLKLEADYSTLFNGLLRSGLTGGYAFGGGNVVDVTWFTRFEPETGDTLGNQIRLSTALAVLPRRLRLEAQLNYDLELSLLQQQRYFLTFTSQCYSVRAELRKFDTLDRQDQDYRIALTLKNVGTFLDLTGRSSTDDDFGN